MRLRSILFAVAVALTVVGAVAVAQQVRDGSTSPTNGLSYWPMGGSDGTNNRVVKLDPSGILRVTEEYPAQYQTTSQTLCSTFPAYQNIIRKYTDGWFCAPFAQKSLRITTAEGTTAAYKLKLFLFGSEDDINYYPIINNLALLSGDADADTAAVDTVMFVQMESQPHGTWIFTFPDNYYPGRYLAVYGQKIPVDGADADSNIVTVTIVGQGRMD